MRSDDLTREQARALKNKLQPILGYLARLRKRMTHCGFQQDNELLQAVQRAEVAMHELHITVHYLSCGNTAGGLPKRHGQARHDRNEYRRDQESAETETPGPR